MKKDIISKSFGIVFIMAGLAYLSGCATPKRETTQGASQERYLLGTYSAVFACDLRMMDKAVRETCEKAHLIELPRVHYMNACEYHYKDINNIPLRINLEELKDGKVKIKIKIGATGDKESSQLLLLEIDSNLRAQGGNM